MFLDEIQSDLNSMTLNEVAQKHQLSISKLNKIIKENNLLIKYKFRTKFSRQLIPIEDKLTQILSSKRRFNKYNANIDISFSQREAEFRTKLLKEDEWRLGCLLAKQENIIEKLNSLTAGIIEQKRYIQLLSNFDGDYVNFLAECKYGKSSESSCEIQSLLSDSIVIAYLSEKYGPAKAAFINSFLEDKHET